MKQINLNDVQEAGQFQRVTAGAYICKITNIEDYPDREYLKVFYDIAEGPLAGYYTKARDEHPDWSWMGAYVKSYKPKALPMFKRFCSAVSKSNGSFVFDGGSVNADEKTLIGKKLGITFREEEYYGNDGNKRTRLSIFTEFPVDRIGDQKVPACKKLVEDPVDDFQNIDENVNEEIPF